MSRERKKQQKRQKQAKKRATRQTVRRTQTRSQRQVRSAGLSEMLEWPLTEAWLGQDWHEQGARVPAVIVREHTSGTLVAAVFDIDLSGPGVVKAALLEGLQQPQLQHHLSQISGEMGLMQVTAGHVLSVVEAGWDLSDEGGTLPTGFARARALFGELTADDRIEVLTGPPEQASQKQGWLSRLMGKRD